MPCNLVSVVVPVYNEAEVIGEMYRRLTQVASTLPDLEYELVVVDDGSRDQSYAALVSLARVDPRLRVLKLSRNFGHQTAITAGIDVARGDAVVVIDADLQDPPEVIPEMVQRWREGFDVVYGVRHKRAGETMMKLARKLEKLRAIFGNEVFNLCGFKFDSRVCGFFAGFCDLAAWHHQKVHRFDKQEGVSPPFGPLLGVLRKLLFDTCDTHFRTH